MDVEKDPDAEEQLLQNSRPKKEFKNKSFSEKLRYCKSNITVEPIFAGFVIPLMLSKLATENLHIDKTCRVKLGYGDDICDPLIHKTGNVSLSSYEGEIQRIISGIESWKSIIQTALPTVLITFIGAWSDRTGNRKIFILLPIFAEFLVCLSNILSTVFFYQISVEVTMVLEALLPAITGGRVMVYLGVFCYISDITDEKSRTFRVGLVYLCFTAGIPLGTALSGILLKLLGYYGVFTISGCIYSITLMYGFFHLKKRTKPRTPDSEKTKRVKITDILPLIKETIMIAFKKRNGNTRKKIILALLVVIIIYGPNHGEMIIMYMYLRYRLKWNAIKYSMYFTYTLITHSFGALFSISVFSKRWGWHDSVLCLISVTSKLAGTVLIAFVKTDFQMFMVPIVEILNATTFTSLRSMTSKLINSDEMGKMNSLFSLVETLAALMFDPTYSAMYSHTILVFSGTVYLFSAAMTLPPIGIMIWFFVQHRMEIKQKRTQENGKEETEIMETNIVM